MAANKVRSEYETLKQIAQAFSQQADATGQTLQRLRQAFGVLEGGKWKGKGAARFYGEMNSSVLPSVTRLQKALENASRVTTQIGVVMKRAEDEAARVLQGDGSGVGAPGGGLEEGGISIGQPVGPSGGSLPGTTEGISTGQPVGPSGGSLPGTTEGISIGQPVGPSGGSLPGTTEGISTGQPVGPSGGSLPGTTEGISTGQPVGPSGGSLPGTTEGISTGQPVGPSGGSLGASSGSDSGAPSGEGDTAS